MSNKPDDGVIDREEIYKEVLKRLETYKGLNLLETVGLFMGKAQILEAALKSLLVEQFGFKYEDVEKWPLGKITRELKEAGLRAD